MAKKYSLLALIILAHMTLVCPLDANIINENSSLMLYVKNQSFQNLNDKYAPPMRSPSSFLPRAILDLKYRFEKEFGVNFNGHIGFADYSTMLGDSGSLGANGFSEMVNYRVELAYLCDFVIKKHAFGLQYSLGAQISSLVTKSMESNGIRMNLTSENVLGANFLVSLRYVFSGLHLFKLTYKNTLTYATIDYTIYRDVLYDDWSSRLDDFNNRIRPGESLILTYAYNFESLAGFFQNLKRVFGT